MIANRTLKLCTCGYQRVRGAGNTGKLSTTATDCQAPPSLAAVLGSSRTEWSKAVSEAERLVGYPTSFMSLRVLLSDELSNVALQMRKLIGTKHPLLKTARRLVYNGKQNSQTRGLLVLLLSKTAGAGNTTKTDVVENMVAGIYPRQRNLAEITEMIHTAYLVHKGVVNIKDLVPSDGATKDMEFGNNISVLSGDFLLASASTALAELYDTHVVELMSSAICDMMKAEFTSLRNRRGEGVLPAEGLTVQDWQHQTFLGSGSLLSKSLKSAMMLANHGEVIQQRAFDFGENMAYAHQIHEDLQLCKNTDEPFNVTSAPVVIHLANHRDDTEFRKLLSNPTFYRQQINAHLLKKGSVEETGKLFQNYKSKAVEALSSFPKSEAHSALINILNAASKS